MSSNLRWKEVKNLWNRQQINLSDDLIADSLRKKSLNNVKIIVFIAIVEFVIVFLTNFFVHIPKDDAHLTLAQKNYFKKFISISDVIFRGNTVLSLGFVMLFIALLKKVKVKCSVSEYLQGIITFRKCVKIFIIWNVSLGILLASMLGYYFFVEGYNTLVPSDKRIHDEHPFQSKIGWILLFSLSVISLSVLWFYYSVIYGIVLRRLKQNLRELQSLGNK